MSFTKTCVIDPGTKANIRFHNNGKVGQIMNLRVSGCKIEGMPDMDPFITLDGFLMDIHENPALCAKSKSKAPELDRVIFAPPATVAYWRDGDKTVVKCDKDDVYDARYGLMLCYLKKLLGGTSRALNDALRTIRDKAEEHEHCKGDIPKEEALKIAEFVKKFGIDRHFCPINSHPEKCDECPYVNVHYPECCERLHDNINLLGLRGEQE